MREEIFLGCRRTAVRLLLCLLGGHVMLAGCNSETPGESYRIDLREGLDSNMFELYGGEDPAVYSQLTNDGLHVTIPKDPESVISAGTAGRFALQGDFVITACYHTHRTPPPDGGHGAGASLVISDDAGQVASLQKVQLSDKSHQFVAHWAMKDADGILDHRARTQPATGTTGQVRLSRAGRRIRYEVKVDGAADFETIHQERFSRSDITLFRLGAQTGESPCKVSVVWQDLEIEADQILSLSDRVQRNRGWAQTYRYVLAAMVLLGVGSAAAWVWQRSREG